MLQYCFCFIFRFFGPEACGILAPQPGIKPVPPSLEGGVLTTGPPGTSPYLYFKPIQKLRVVEMKWLTLLVGSAARKQSHVRLTSPLYSLSAYFNNNITVTEVLKCFELLGWTIALELQSGIMLQKSEWWWDSGYAREPLHLILAERRRSSCQGPFKRPRLHGSGPASSSSLSSGGGCPWNSYQCRKGLGGSSSPFDTAIVQKDTLSVKCARGLCFQEFRAGKSDLGRSCMVSLEQSRHARFLPSPCWVVCWLSGFLEPGGRVPS